MPGTGATGRCRQQNLASLSEHPGRRWQTGHQCARSHRAGPWQNFKGEVVAQSVDDLHSDNNKLDMQTTLTERGAMIPGVGYTPVRHDALTGSQADGRAFPAGEDRTCHNWTSSTQGRRCWAISTERVCVTMRLHTRGIHRIRRADQTAVAAKPICAALVAMVCSIALQLSDLWQPQTRCVCVAAVPCPSC